MQSLTLWEVVGGWGAGGGVVWGGGGGGGGGEGGRGKGSGCNPTSDDQLPVPVVNCLVPAGQVLILVYIPAEANTHSGGLSKQFVDHIPYKLTL